MEKLQLMVPLPTKPPRSQWLFPDVEVIISAESLSIAYFDDYHNCQANKNEVESEELLYGEFAAPIVLNRASYWQFDNADRSKVTAIVVSLRKLAVWQKFYHR